MPKPVLSIEGLGKKYLVGHQLQQQRGYATFREAIGKAARDLVRTSCEAFQGKQLVQGDEVEEFWALRDVSFQVKPGEAVGIIGRNGAGKSTLLKVLSRITEPSEGRVILRGRIASLLEVGTGFHPELTGRENVYLNGAILGMTHGEIRSKFDEIVAFAEVEKFLDTPVKRFSSGMYVRLAFAVAAHLEPEILIVDEVLAVGDADFQKKCLNKMKQVSDAGRTILFVSHNLSAVLNFCNRGIVMKDGKLVKSSTAREAVEFYASRENSGGGFEREKPVDVAKPCFVSISKDADFDETKDEVRFTAVIHSPGEVNVALDVRIEDSVGSPVGYGSLGTFSPGESCDLRKGRNEIRFGVSVKQLTSGSYYVSFDLNEPYTMVYDRAEKVFQITVNRSLRNGQVRTLEQGWSYGSYVADVTKLS